MPRIPMGGKKTEACGRCSVTTVIDATDDKSGESGAENPFDGERIEIKESQIRSVVPHEVFTARIRTRLDEWATKLTFGR